MVATSQTTEKVHVLELTETELKEMLGTAVKQLVRIAKEPASDQEVATLGSVIEKCSKLTLRSKKKA